MTLSARKRPTNWTALAQQTHTRASGLFVRSFCQLPGDRELAPGTRCWFSVTAAGLLVALLGQGVAVAVSCDVPRYAVCWSRTSSRSVVGQREAEFRVAVLETACLGPVFTGLGSLRG